MRFFPNLSSSSTMLGRTLLALLMFPVIICCGGFGPTASITVPPMQDDGSTQKSEAAPEASKTPASTDKKWKTRRWKLPPLEPVAFGVLRLFFRDSKVSVPSDQATWVVEHPIQLTMTSAPD